MQKTAMQLFEGHLVTNKDHFLHPNLHCFKEQVAFLLCSNSTIVNWKDSSIESGGDFASWFKAEKEDKLIFFCMNCENEELRHGVLVQLFTINLLPLYIFSLINWLPEEPVINICVPETSLFHLQTKVESAKGIRFCVSINYSELLCWAPSFSNCGKSPERKKRYPATIVQAYF